MPKHNIHVTFRHVLTIYLIAILVLRDIIQFLQTNLPRLLFQLLPQTCDGDFRLWGKLRRTHITQYTLIESSALRIFGSLLQVAHADEELACAHLPLHHKTEFVAALDIVDDLHDRLVILRKVVQHQRMRVLDNREPLPVGVHLGREITEDRMLWIGKDTQCARRYSLLVVLTDSLEHTIVPVIGLEETANGIWGGIACLRNRIGKSHEVLRGRRHPKHLGTLFELLCYLIS